MSRSKVVKWLLALSLTLALRAAAPCAACHHVEATSYERTPMGRSLQPVATGPRANFLRGPTRYTVDATQHAAARDNRTAAHRALWQIGSGSHAAGFLVQIAGAWFQSPIAWYPKQQKWDVAPGYETLDHVDFNRRVTGDCLQCHSSPAPDGLAPIACERCHGAGDAHAARPSRANIVNPARLAGPERISVCEQCHLTGEARIPSPGAPAYRPGMRLEDAVSTYVRSRDGLKVVSHVEQLADSPCAKFSPQLWCGTCHNAHGDKIDVDAQCRACHATRSASHPRADENCAGCHMPKQKAVDGLHTAFTDHRIARPGAPRPARDNQLRAWRPGPHEERNAALALLAGGDPAEMLEGFRRLSAVYPRYPRDPEVLAGLGFLLFLKDQHADAAKLLEAAIAARPGHAPYYQKLALARRAAGQKTAAVAALENAIRFDPLEETSYFLLAETAPERRVEALERLLKLNPRHLAARAALGRP
jgi:hypothetical protein